MSQIKSWPALPYSEFKSTAHLLHMGLQAIGKLKLNNPFEPHWAHVALWITASGLTTGPVTYISGIFSVDINILEHQVSCVTSWGLKEKFDITPMSVAQFAEKLLILLKKVKVDVTINTMPQEIPNPIAFEKDIKPCEYNKDLAHAWWIILVNSYRVLQRYHARFCGETPPVGFMWGTFDLRDARYNGIHVNPTGINSGYLRRNAMDEGQVEAGWWSGTDEYPHPAYYSFIYPQPEGIEHAKIKPAKARWEKTFGEFLLDYEDVRNSSDPESDLFNFFESTYAAEAKLAEWDSKLIVVGHPV